MNRNDPKIIHKFDHYRFTLYLSHDEAFYSVRIKKNEDHETVFFGTPIQLAYIMQGKELTGFYASNYILEGLNEKQLMLFNSSPPIQNFLKVVEQARKEASINKMHDYYDSLTEYDNN